MITMSTHDHCSKTLFKDNNKMLTILTLGTEVCRFTLKILYC